MESCFAEVKTFSESHGLQFRVLPKIKVIVCGPFIYSSLEGAMKLKIVPFRSICERLLHGIMFRYFQFLAEKHRL